MAAAQHHHGISCSLRRQSGLFRILASPAGRVGALLSWLKRIPSPVLWAVWLGTRTSFACAARSWKEDHREQMDSGCPGRSMPC